MKKGLKRHMGHDQASSQRSHGGGSREFKGILGKYTQTGKDARGMLESRETKEHLQIKGHVTIQKPVLSSKETILRLQGQERVILNYECHNHVNSLKNQKPNKITTMKRKLKIRT